MYKAHLWCHLWAPAMIRSAVSIRGSLPLTIRFLELATSKWLHHLTLLGKSCKAPHQRLEAKCWTTWASTSAKWDYSWKNRLLGQVTVVPGQVPVWQTRAHSRSWGTLKPIRSCCQMQPQHGRTATTVRPTVSSSCCPQRITAQRSPSQ